MAPGAKLLNRAPAEPDWLITANSTRVRTSTELVPDVRTSSGGACQADWAGRIRSIAVARSSTTGRICFR
jgi:hypothetical protein